MNKADLVDALVEVTEERKSIVTGVLDGLVHIVQEAMADGEDVTLPGLGKFEAKHRPARKARNPRTGEQIQVGESYVVKFKPAAKLKEAAAA